jgi:hypothetical protein
MSSIPWSRICVFVKTLYLLVLSGKAERHAHSRYSSPLPAKAAISLLWEVPKRFFSLLD